MLEHFYTKRQNGGEASVRTTGCSCCSVHLDIKTNKEQIIREAKHNVEVAMNVARHYKIPFDEFIKDLKPKPTGYN